MGEYRVLDTSYFDRFLENRNTVVEEYNNINKRYKKMKKNLLLNWKGKGADAFEKDCDQVYANLVSINDALQTMCDALMDCKTVLEEFDLKMKEANLKSIE